MFDPKQYYKKNRKHLLKYQNEYYRKNREKILAKQREINRLGREAWKKRNSDPSCND